MKRRFLSILFQIIFRLHSLLSSSRSIQIPFLSEDHAQLVRQVLQVDQELSAGAVKRTLDVQGNILIV